MCIMNAGAPRRREENIGSPGVGITGSYELPSVGSGRQTLVLYKSITWSSLSVSLQPRAHFCSSSSIANQ